MSNIRMESGRRISQDARQEVNPKGNRLKNKQKKTGSNVEKIVIIYFVQRFSKHSCKMFYRSPQKNESETMRERIK